MNVFQFLPVGNFQLNHSTGFKGLLKAHVNAFTWDFVN